MQSQIYPLTLYYDAACPLCNAEMRNLMLRNQAGLLRFVDASAPGFVTPPPGCTQAELLMLIHAQTATGEVVRGVEVFRLAYAAVGLPEVSRVLRLPLLSSLAERLYPWLARNRRRVPAALVRTLFERRLRKAAERAAHNARCQDGVCHHTPNGSEA